MLCFNFHISKNYCKYIKFLFDLNFEYLSINGRRVGFEPTLEEPQSSVLTINTNSAIRQTSKPSTLFQSLFLNLNLQAASTSNPACLFANFSV